MKNYENLVDEHLEFMIRLACEAQEDAEIDELIAESQLEHTPEEKEITRNAYLLFQRKLAEQERKERNGDRKRGISMILCEALTSKECEMSATWNVAQKKIAGHKPFDNPVIYGHAWACVPKARR